MRRRYMLKEAVPNASQEELEERNTARTRVENCKIMSELTCRRCHTGTDQK
jgi:hypothetical protein